MLGWSRGVEESRGTEMVSEIMNSTKNHLVEVVYTSENSILKILSIA